MVVADGHHRYETSLTYKAEREAADGDAGDAGATLAYLVELVEDELTVHAIHRLLVGPARRTSTWSAALAPVVRGRRVRRPPTEPVTAAMADAGCLTLVLPDREVLLRPRPDALADARDLDSSRLDVALAALPAHELRFQHGVDHVRAGGRAAATRRPGVLLRPVTVAQIEATAHGGERMPPEVHVLPPQAQDRPRRSAASG